MAKLNVDALRKGMGRQFNNQQSIYGNKGNDNSTIKVGSGLMEAMNMKSAEMEESSGYFTIKYIRQIKTIGEYERGRR